MNEFIFYPEAQPILDFRAKIVQKFDFSKGGTKEKGLKDKRHCKTTASVLQ
ncbi:MAG: hypothetical protein BACD_03202 [Bacteroides rodentium]